MHDRKRTHDKLFISLEKILSRSPLFSSAYVNFFEKATLEEFEMAHIKKDDTVLHIGCGSLPNTLISLGRNIGASYVGIDIDNAAVATAQKLVKKYTLDNVKIEYGNAQDYPLKNFDFIIVSFGVEPKENVFERIRKEMKDYAKIIYRKQWDFMDKIYGSIRGHGHIQRTCSYPVR